MTPQHVLDEMLRDVRVPQGRGLGPDVSQHDIIHHSERRHQFCPCSLREQRPFGIGYFYHQRPILRGVFPQAPDMFGQQRIKMAGNPAGRFSAQALGSVFGGYYFRARVQE